MNIHCIGIGGIGLSALARLLHEEGHQVSGSDASPSALTEELKKEGISVYDEHRDVHISQSIDWVIYSEAISKDNPEYREALSLGLKTSSYFEALGEWGKTKKMIAIAGTHGKTTTTAMTALILTEGDMDPSVVVGSKVNEFGGKNMRAGKSDLLVVEACEYRASFHHLSPFCAIVTNCEVDHLDYYENETAYHDAFLYFLQKIPSDGYVVCDLSDEHLKELTADLSCNIIDISEKELVAGIQMSLPGDHIKFDALLAQEAARIFGVDDASIKKSLSSFQGTWRRMEKRGEYKGALLYDDYGHHPTEIRVTLKALREAHPDKRIICVYQPHQYSRTALLLDDFKTAFKDADLVVIPNIYEARDSEEDKKKVSAESFVQTVQEYHKGEVIYGDGLSATADKLKGITSPNDVLITMGAGNVFKVLEYLKNS